MLDPRPSVSGACLVAGILMLTAAAIWPASALAERIYQWKDADGVTHFTDDVGAVPLQYRGQSQRDLEPLTGIGSEADTGGADEGLGRRIWETKCQACHVYDSSGTQQGRKGLRSYILNPETKFPYPEATITASLRKGVKGTGEGMPAIEISEKEMKALVRFLVGQVSKP